MWSVLLALALGGGVASPNELDSLIERIQSHYDGLSDFRAHFSQRYVRPIVQKVIEESGTVAFKKPAFMRWEYRTPENKLFVTDGSKSYFYVPEDRQVIVSHSAEGAMGLTAESPLALLMGRTRLAEAFLIRESTSEPQVGGRVLHLTPRDPQEEFEEAAIEVEPEEGRIRRVVLMDGQGNRTEFRFDDIRENQGLSADLFRFTVPAGVEIVLASDAAMPASK